MRKTRAGFVANVEAQGVWSLRESSLLSNDPLLISLQTERDRLPVII